MPSPQDIPFCWEHTLLGRSGLLHCYLLPRLQRSVFPTLLIFVETPIYHQNSSPFPTPHRAPPLAYLCLRRPLVH